MNKKEILWAVVNKKDSRVWLEDPNERASIFGTRKGAREWKEEGDKIIRIRIIEDTKELKED
jgi:hypothetical protein